MAMGLRWPVAPAALLLLVAAGAADAQSSRPCPDARETPAEYVFTFVPSERVDG